MNVVEVGEAAVRFGSGRGLHEVSLRVREGDIVALLGPSGAGKTTLLRTIAGMQTVDEGTVRVLGVDPAQLWGRRRRNFRQALGLMMQNHQLVEGLRVFHNVAMGRLGRWSTIRALTNLVWPQRADVDRVATALTRVELPGRLWDWPRMLSGGERQRVALARLVVQDPQLWLLDEPAAGLDPRLRREVLGMLIELVRQRRGTLVVTLHDVELVDEVFDRVVGLRHGRIIFDLRLAQLDADRLDELYRV